MAQKRSVPFWLALALALLLVVLLVLVAMVPQPEYEQTAVPRIELPTKQKLYSPKNKPVPLEHSKQAKAKDIVPTQAVAKQVKPVEPESDQYQPIAPTPVQSQIQSPSSPQPYQPRLTPAKDQGIALIMDDMGYDIGALKRLLKLSVPMAISVLPNAPHARAVARLAKQAGQVVMLHLPMQPQNASLRITDAFLRVGMQEHEVREKFLSHLAKVPYVEGVNNHMGSKLTQLDQPMRWVMQLCREKNLFFVDSRTSGRSVATAAAKDMGLAWASRRYFLDHDLDIEAMKRSWQQVRACVRKGHRCVVIAHPKAKTIAFLEKHLNKEDAANMVSIKGLLRGSAGAIKAK